MKITIETYSTLTINFKIIKNWKTTNKVTFQKGYCVEKNLLIIYSYTTGTV